MSCTHFEYLYHYFRVCTYPCETSWVLVGRYKAVSDRTAIFTVRMNSYPAKTNCCHNVLRTSRKPCSYNQSRCFPSQNPHHNSKISTIVRNYFPYTFVNIPWLFRHPWVRIPWYAHWVPCGFILIGVISRLPPLSCV